MRHRLAGRSFGRRTGPRKALIRGLCTNLIDSERITTTLAKAKELRSFVEPLITLAKRGDLHARRQAAGQIYTKETLQKLFSDLAVRFKDRPGGYTRIMRGAQRLGDGAPTAIIEFVDRKEKTKPVGKTSPKSKKDPKADKKNAEKNTDKVAYKKAEPKS
jgi:large subunit ribosomal protein L17